MSRKRQTKRQRNKVPPRDIVLRTSQEVLTDIRMDVIGYDSCVLATKLLHDRLAAKEISSKPIGCIAVATVETSDGELLVASLSNENEQGHAVLFAEGLLIDLTVNQFSELDGRIPGIQPIVAALPNIQDPVFSIELNPPGVHLEYFFDTNQTPFFLDSYDWQNPDLEASVLKTQRLIDRGQGYEIRRITRQHHQQSIKRPQRT